MKLTEMTVSSYLAAVRSEDAAPGGGSASALCGSQGAGLLAMVCHFTIHNQRYEEAHAICREVLEKANALSCQLEESIDRDTQAYRLFADAMKMPRETEDEKAKRKAAMAAASLEATKVPFSVMEMGLAGLVLCGDVVEGFNKNTASDLGSGVTELLSCVRGAWLNVKINLSSVQPEELREKYRREAEAILAESEELAGELLRRIEAVI